MAKEVRRHSVYAFRHAEAVPAKQMLMIRTDEFHSPYAMDRARRLSEEGREQAEILHGFLKDKKIIEAFASPANRAYSTAALAAGIPVQQVTILESLIYGDPSNSKETHFLNYLLDSGGDALRAHRLTDLKRRGHTLKGTKVFDAWGKEAWDVLKSDIFKHLEGNFLVIGHGILLQEVFRTAISRGINGRNRADREEMAGNLLDMELSNGDGFCVTFEDKKPQSVELIPFPAKQEAAA